MLHLANLKRGCLQAPAAFGLAGCALNVPDDTSAAPSMPWTPKPQATDGAQPGRASARPEAQPGTQVRQAGGRARGFVVPAAPEVASLQATPDIARHKAYDLSELNEGQDRTLAPDPEEPHPAGELLPARRPRGPDRGVRRALQPKSLPREPEQRDARRRLLRQGSGHHQTARKDQATDHRTSALATQQARRITSILKRGHNSANLRHELRQMF